ncbi:MAG: class I SAM-dependent methyltransferase [Mariprofundaceae bacterium]
MRRIYVPYGESEAYQGMSAAQRDLLILRHKKSVEHFGFSAKALYWASSDEQDVRFKTLAGINVSNGDSLLDVGCGFSDLFHWLKSHKMTVDYTGIDISPDVLHENKQRNPDLTLLSGELFDFDWPAQSFDWVFLSGTLNWDVADGADYAKRTIKRMFKFCRLGVAFNLLDIRDLGQNSPDHLFAYDAQEMFAFCKEITSDCQLYDGYEAHDFTIYMRRSK